MSFLERRSEMHLASASGSLLNIGFGMESGNATAAGPTTGVVPAAVDPVSGLTAARFAAHGAQYQAISAQAALIHDQLVATFANNAAGYSGNRGHQQQPHRLAGVCW